MLRICLLALCALLTAATSFGSVIAYDVPAGPTGNQAWTGSLGMDFDVHSPIWVTSLGVFDSGQDGVIGHLTAGIYDRDSQTAVTPLLVFTETDGTLVGGSRFQALEIPFFLLPGHYSIVAWGYGPDERNGNTHGGQGTSVLNTGGSISFVGVSRYSNGTGYPTILDGGPENRYLAGTFEFEPVPEPSTLALIGAGLAIAGLLRRR